MSYEVTWNDMRGELADYVRLKQEFGTIHFAPGNAFNIDLHPLLTTSTLPKRSSTRRIRISFSSAPRNWSAPTAMSS
ncbi:MAG: hypothetical protein ABIU29_08545 [Chthoniobacterales bacterium]